MNARNELARFYSTKQKAKEALANAAESSATTNADGSETVKESFSRMQAEINSSSAEALLSGVVVLGRDIDAPSKTVTITVGVSYAWGVLAHNRGRRAPFDGESKAMHE